MTNPNPSPENRFKKGDPRIWRKGRPKSFDAFRELSIAIANEEAKGKSEDGKSGKCVIINGHKATIAEMVVRQWFMSGNFQKQLAAIQYAYGKVPDDINLKGSLKTLVEYVNTPYPITDVSPSASGDTPETEEV
jgi:hypothetical protein